MPLELIFHFFGRLLSTTVSPLEFGPQGIVVEESNFKSQATASHGVEDNSIGRGGEL